MPYFKRLLPVRYGIGAAAAAMRYGYGRYYPAISRRRRIANRNYLKGGISRVGYITKKKRYPRRYRRSRLRVKKNPFRIGRKRGNISRVYRIKCISQVNLEFNWDKDHTGGAQSIADKATTDASIWFGNRYENWEEYARQVAPL